LAQQKLLLYSAFICYIEAFYDAEG